MTKILIVDDHPILRMGMRELLNQEDGFEVCAVAENISSARKAIAETLLERQGWVMAWQPQKRQGRRAGGRLG